MAGIDREFIELIERMDAYAEGVRTHGLPSLEQELEAVRESATELASAMADPEFPEIIRTQRPMDATYLMNWYADHAAQHSRDALEDLIQAGETMLNCLKVEYARR